MNMKRSRPTRGAGRLLTNDNRPDQKSAISRGDVLRVDANVNSGDRVLIDRFGHQHTRGVLKLWPDRVKSAMGLRFVDRSELEAQL